MAGMANEVCIMCLGHGFFLWFAFIYLRIA